jgi:hypothetical protein
MTAPLPEYLFLSGADMDPTALLRAQPAARFIARASTVADAGETASAFAAGLERAVWGVLVELPKAPDGRLPRRIVTTDDGRHFIASCAGEHFLAGDPAAVYAAARYWELPPAFTKRLEQALAWTDDD